MAQSYPPGMAPCPRCRQVIPTSSVVCPACGLQLASTGPAIDSSPPPPSVAPATGGRRRAFLFLALAVALAVAVALGAVIAVGGLNLLQSGEFTGKRLIAGTLELHDTGDTFSVIQITGTTCRGKDGYSDLGPGMPVTVKDENGKLLGATSLGPATLVGTGTGGSAFCRFSFNVMVDPAQIYSIEPGRRGAVSYPRHELEANGWRVGLIIRGI